MTAAAVAAVEAFETLVYVVEGQLPMPAIDLFLDEVLHLRLLVCVPARLITLRVRVVVALSLQVCQKSQKGPLGRFA